MLIISHRINTSASLLKTPVRFGVEIDIRSNENQLILQHDPFLPGETFSDWLKNYKHAFLILNVKEEGLEKAVTELLKKYGITNYFFLDQSFPFLIKSANQGETRCAVRYSEFESIDTVLSLSGKVNWVWADCFTQYPLTKSSEEKLHQHQFKLCLVSPELQGRTEIEKTQHWLKENKINIDAVCTKNPTLWEHYVKK